MSIEQTNRNLSQMEDDMSACCDCTTLEKVLGEVTVNLRPTEGGLALEVTPKDPERAGFLRDLARGAAKVCAPAASDAAGCAEACC
jgi:hypothetical protein